MTLVCRHWRNLALADAHLWTSMHEVSSKCGSPCLRNEALLERSRGMPLSFSVRDEWDPTRAEASRARELSIRVCDLPFDTVADHLSFPAPNLEHLLIDGSPFYPTDQWGPSEAQIPVLLFEGLAPRLSMLCLESTPYTPRNNFSHN